MDKLRKCIKFLQTPDYDASVENMCDGKPRNCFAERRKAKYFFGAEMRENTSENIEIENRHG